MKKICRRVVIAIVFAVLFQTASRAQSLQASGARAVSIAAQQAPAPKTTSKLRRQGLVLILAGGALGGLAGVVKYKGQNYRDCIATAFRRRVSESVCDVATEPHPYLLWGGAGIAVTGVVLMIMGRQRTVAATPSLVLTPDGWVVRQHIRF